jgi:hypothetical protein
MIRRTAMPQDLTERVFSTVDAARPDAFADLLAPDGRFVFGNAEPLVGRDAVAAGCTGFFASIAGLRHKLVNVWRVGPDTIAETDVTYRRHDGNSVVVPVVSIWRTSDEGLIVDYRVFGILRPCTHPCLRPDERSGQRTAAIRAATSVRNAFLSIFPTFVVGSSSTSSRCSGSLNFATPAACIASRTSSRVTVAPGRGTT